MHPLCYRMCANAPLHVAVAYPVNQRRDNCILKLLLSCLTCSMHSADDVSRGADSASSSANLTGGAAASVSYTCARCVPFSETCSALPPLSAANDSPLRHRWLVTLGPNLLSAAAFAENVEAMQLLMEAGQSRSTSASPSPSSHHRRLHNRAMDSKNLNKTRELNELCLLCTRVMARRAS